MRASGFGRRAAVLAGALLVVGLAVTPSGAAGQQIDRFREPIATDAGVITTADARISGMVVGAIIGGLLGGTITAGCLALHGMGAPAALPYCVIPTIAGMAFGAWVGGNMMSGARHGRGGPSAVTNAVGYGLRLSQGGPMTSRRIMIAVATAAALLGAGDVAAQASESFDVITPSAGAQTEMVADEPSTARLAATGAFAGFVIGTVIGGMVGLESNDEWGMLVIIPAALLGTTIGALVGVAVGQRR